MYNFIMTLLIIVSVLIIIATMMQPQKQQRCLERTLCQAAPSLAARPRSGALKPLWKK